MNYRALFFILITWILSFPLLVIPADRKTDAAGCFIATEAGVVLGINRLLNRVQLPVGRTVGAETAEQTAIRETLEETGIAVEVIGRLLSLDEHHRVVLFLCKPVNSRIDYATLEAKDKIEIAEVLVLNPHNMRNHDGRIISTPWRYPETQLLLQALYPKQP